MGKKLHIGNLSPSATAEDLLAIFARFGTVEFAKIMTNTQSRFSGGYGLVEMSCGAEAQIAIDKLNFTQWDGRIMSVSAFEAE